MPAGSRRNRRCLKSLDPSGAWMAGGAFLGLARPLQPLWFGQSVGIRVMVKK